MHRGISAVATAVVAAATIWVSAAPAATHRASTATETTIATGLDNPRGLTFTNGRLYVAEAGHGGSTCFTIPGEDPQCLGFTSSVTRIGVTSHRKTRVLSGLLSIAGPDGSAATGIDGVSSRGQKLYGIETGAGLSIPPGLQIPAAVLTRVKKQIGRLVIGQTSGGWRATADIGDRDFVWSSHHQRFDPGEFPDANPYGVLATASSILSVDAGSNTLDRIGRGNVVHVLRYIPNPASSDSVPTCLAKGRDGAIYIGELTGGGNEPGASVVWRYAPKTNSLTRWATGLTAVTGCGFAPDGRFYAVEFSTNGIDNPTPGTGLVVRVPAQSTQPTPVIGGLSFPSGFAAAPNGALYVSNWSIATAHSAAGAPTGSVVRITLP